MPPKAALPKDLKSVSKRFLFQIESQSPVNIPLSFLYSPISKQTKGKPDDPKNLKSDSTVEDLIVNDLYLYMLVDFQPSDGESLPLFPIPVKRIDRINITQYKTNQENDPVYKVDGFSTADSSLTSQEDQEQMITTFRQIRKSSHFSLTIDTDSEESFLELLESSVVAYLVVCKKINTSQESQQSQKKAQTTKGKLDPSALSRQRLEKFILDNNGQYIKEFNLGKEYLKQFAFDTRIQNVIEGDFVVIDSGKKKDPNKNAQEIAEISSNPLQASFTVSLLNSTDGILSDISISPYFLRIHLEKLEDMPQNEYSSFSNQISPVFIEFNVKGKNFSTATYSHSKTIKIKHDTIIQFGKEEIDEWRDYFEGGNIPFIIRDRNLSVFPLPVLQNNEVHSSSMEEINSNQSFQQFSTEKIYYPTSIKQYFGTSIQSLKNLFDGKTTYIREDLLIQSNSEDISIPLPIQEPNSPSVDPKKGKANQKGKPVDDPIEKVPSVNYTEEKIIVRSGNYVENGSFLKVVIQLSKKLPPLDLSNRIGHIIIQSNINQSEIIEKIYDFIYNYEPEKEEREINVPQIQAKGKPNTQEVKEKELVVVDNDFFNGVIISSPYSEFIIIEGLNSYGIKNLTTLVQNIKKEYTDLKVIANSSFTRSQRLYLPLIKNSEIKENEKTIKFWNIRLRNQIQQLLELKEAQSNHNILEIVSNLIDLTKSQTLSQIYSNSLWPSYSELEMIQNTFGLKEEEWESFQNAQENLNEELYVEIHEVEEREQASLSMYLNHFLTIEGIPNIYPPSGLPEARAIQIEDEQERWEYRRKVSECQENSPNIVEDKIWITVPSFNNQSLIISILPKENIILDYNVGNEKIEYKEGVLPPYNVTSTFSGILVGTSLKNIYCLLVNEWKQLYESKIDNKLHKKYIPKQQKYEKNHFVNLNKEELHKKSELIKKKRKIEQRLEESKLHPLIREARQKVIEATKNAPVYLYSGQKNRWSDLQQAAMREAMKKAKRMQNYTFSKGDYLSLSFSAISPAEEEKSKMFRDTSPVKDKAQFKYPAPRDPGTWTIPDKQLHPSKIVELQTTTYIPSYSIKDTQSKSNISKKPSFQFPSSISKEFSHISFLDSSESMIGLQSEIERRKRKEAEEWRNKLVVDNPVFHVSNKSNMHPLEKKNSMLHSEPQKLYLKKKPLLPEQQSIFSSGKFEDVASRPFETVLTVVPTRTKLPVSLGKRDNVASFYVSGKVGPLSALPNSKKSIHPLLSNEKEGAIWGK